MLFVLGTTACLLIGCILLAMGARAGLGFLVLAGLGAIQLGWLWLRDRRVDARPTAKDVLLQATVGMTVGAVVAIAAGVALLTGTLGGYRPAGVPVIAGGCGLIYLAARGWRLLRARRPPSA
jgi:hypothetical protein